MALRAITEADSDPGTWFTWGPDDETGQPIRFRIRRLPGAVEQKLILDSLGGRKVGQVEGQAALFSRTVARLRERAALALADSEGLVVIPADAGAAERLGAPVGEPLRLDGAWTPERRDAFMRLYPAIQSWVNERLDELVGAARDREVEEGKT